MLGRGEVEASEFKAGQRGMSQTTNENNELNKPLNKQIELEIWRGVGLHALGGVRYFRTAKSSPSLKWPCGHVK